MVELNKNLLKGSIILVIAFGFFNFFNFLFQLIMARMLTVAEYGILAALFSILYALLVASESVQTILTKFSANESDKGKLKNLLRKSVKKAFVVSLVLFILYLVIAIPLSPLLKIDYFLLALNGLMIFLVFFMPIGRGVLQGRERFKALGINMIVESVAKVIFGVAFVFIGWKVYGAVFGAFLGGLLAVLLSFVPLSDVLRSKEGTAKVSGIYKFAKPTLIITTVVVLFYSFDVLVAKVLFPAEVVGSYAIASILSKIIFWGTLPISKAMFPATSRKMKSDKSENLFMNALGLVALLAFLALFVFYFFPELVVKIFSGKDLAMSSSILFYLGIATTLLSVANLILLYKLSLGKTKGYLLLFLFVLFEIVLLSYFSANLVQFSLAFITSAAVFLWGSVFLMND